MGPRRSDPRSSIGLVPNFVNSGQRMISGVWKHTNQGVCFPPEVQCRTFHTVAVRAGLTFIPRAAIGLVAMPRTRAPARAHRRARVVALAVFVLGAVPAHAEINLHYRVWTTEEGLPQGSVRAIAQTPDGYLWIATLDGLVRFDGVRMVVFSKSDYPEMSSNRILSLLVDRRGTLWAGTEDGGVLQKHETGFRVFGRSSGLESDIIGEVAEGSAGRIWVNTAAGAAVLDGDRWTQADASLFPRTEPPPDLRLPGSTGGGSRRIPLRWTKGGNGRQWVFDGGYLYLRTGEAWKRFDNPVPSVALPMPTSLFEDREGTLWIGGELGGLVQASPTAVRAIVPPGSPNERNVYTLSGDTSGRVWVTTQGDAFLWEQGTLLSLDTRSWWPRDWVTTIEPDRDGTVLAAGPSALFRIWPGRRFEKLRDVDGRAVLDTLRDRQGTLWLGTGGSGLLQQAGTQWRRIDGLPSDDVKVLLESQDGALWVGTYGGLARVTGDDVRTWTTADGLSSDRIRSLHEDEAGVLWIGTYDAGLNRFADGSFVPIRKRDGLYDDGVFAILDGGDGRYYMSSNRGIHSVAKRELDAFVSGASRHVTHRAWRRADGMPSSECNGGRQPSGLRAADGTLWFPTQGGVAVIDPRAVPENRFPPPVVVEEVTAGRRTVLPGEPIVLAPGERRLEVRYTANTFVRPESARFRYRLAGYDDDWVEAGNRRFAQYANVPPGGYVLTILAANSDGVWNTEGVSLSIRIDPYWWQTLWFRAAAALLAVGLLGAAYQRRISALKRRRAEQDAFARRLLEYQEAERKRIASELHDGIGQTLVVIRNRALLGLRDQGGPASVRQIEEIATVAGEAIEDVRKVAYALRPYQLDRLGLKRALHALVEGTATSSGIPVDAAIGDVDGLIAKDDEINVYRIVQEGMSNMVRHARASRGHVAVVVRGREIEVRIEDDGIGFEPAGVEGGGLGLTGIAERTRILGGRVTVRSAAGQGTCLVVNIPARSPSPSAEA